MGAAAPKAPLAIPPHSLLWGGMAFSHEDRVGLNEDHAEMPCGSRVYNNDHLQRPGSANNRSPPGKSSYETRLYSF